MEIERYSQLAFLFNSISILLPKPGKSSRRSIGARCGWAALGGGVPAPPVRPVVVEVPLKLPVGLLDVPPHVRDTLPIVQAF